MPRHFYDGGSSYMTPQAPSGSHRAITAFSPSVFVADNPQPDKRVLRSIKSKFSPPCGSSQRNSSKNLNATRTSLPKPLPVPPARCSTRGCGCVEAYAAVTSEGIVR